MKVKTEITQKLIELKSTDSLVPPISKILSAPMAECDRV